MKCKYCGTELADDVVFCSTCGKKIEEMQSIINENIDEEKSSKSNKEKDSSKGMLDKIAKFIMGGLECVLLIMVIGALLGFYDKNPMPFIVLLVIVTFANWIEEKTSRFPKIIIAIFEIVALIICFNIRTNTINETQPTKSQTVKNENNLNDSEFQVSYSENYLDEDFQMDTSVITEKYKNSGYEEITFFSHEVKSPEGGKSGDNGTVDEITYMIIDKHPKGYYSIQQTMGSVYVYWDGEWKENSTFDGMYGYLLDLSGYNETYWITKDYDDISNLIWSIEDENMRREFHSMIDEVDLSEICAYAKFYNMNTLNIGDKYNTIEAFGNADIMDIIIEVGDMSISQALHLSHEGVKLTDRKNEVAEFTFLVKNRDEYSNSISIRMPEPEFSDPYSVSFEESTKETYEEKLNNISHTSSREDADGLINKYGDYIMINDGDEYYTYLISIFDDNGVDTIMGMIYDIDGGNPDGFYCPISNSENGVYSGITEEGYSISLWFNEERLNLLSLDERHSSFSGEYVLDNSFDPYNQ